MSAYSPVPAPRTTNLIVYHAAEGITQGLMVGMALRFLITLGLIVCLILQIGLLGRMAAHEAVSPAAIQGNDARLQLVNVADLAVTVLTLVLVCVWTYRANKNAHALGAAGMRFTPGWSVGWFFVPFLNLVRPYQVMMEIWQASNPAPATLERNEWKWVPGSALIGFWWAAWIGGALLQRIISIASGHDNSAAALQAASVAALLPCVLDLAVAALTILLVRGIHQRQQQRYLNLHLHRPRTAAPGADAVDPAEALAAAALEAVAVDAEVVPPPGGAGAADSVPPSDPAGVPGEDLPR